MAQQMQLQEPAFITPVEAAEVFWIRKHQRLPLSEAVVVQLPQTATLALPIQVAAVLVAIKALSCQADSILFTLAAQAVLAL